VTRRKMWYKSTLPTVEIVQEEDVLVRNFGATKKNTLFKSRTVAFFTGWLLLLNLIDFRQICSWR